MLSSSVTVLVSFSLLLNSCSVSFQLWSLSTECLIWYYIFLVSHISFWFFMFVCLVKISSWVCLWWPVPTTQHLGDGKVKHFYSASASQDLPKRKERKLHLCAHIEYLLCWNFFMVMMSRSLTGKSDTLFWHRLSVLRI